MTRTEDDVKESSKSRYSRIIARARRGVAFFALIGSLLGCGDRRTEATVTTPASTPAPVPVSQPAPPPPKTAEDWKRGLQASYTELLTKDEGNGVTSFMACFERAAPGAVNADGKPIKCGNVAFGSWDAFQKARMYTPSNAHLWWRLGDESLLPRIFLADCGVPFLTLKAGFFSKRGYMFMHKVAVMVDDDVASENEFIREKVLREPYAAGVREEYIFVATEKDIEALRRMATAKKVLVRIIGDKGYVSLEKNELKLFVEESAAALSMYDKLMRATKPNAMPSCG